MSAGIPTNRTKDEQRRNPAGGRGKREGKSIDASIPFDFAGINRAALSRCPDLLFSLLPGGRIQGREYVASALSGGNGSSLSVNVSSGVWKDFATDEGGSDLVSLLAAVRGVGQGEAARMLSEITGVPASAEMPLRHQDAKPVPVVPVPDGAPKPPSRHPRLGEAAASFAYRDTAGRLLGFVCRFNRAEADSRGKLQKEFCPQVWTRQGWRWQALPEPRPLYGLDRLAQATSGASILVLEGEGKADAVSGVLGPNVAVLSLNGGSGGVGRLDLSPLRGRKVLYWPDNDAPGHKAAQRFMDRAKEAGAASVALVIPPEGMPEGWDAGDAVKEGWGRDRLVSHIRESQAEGLADDTAEGDKAEHAEIRLPPPPPVPLEAFPDTVAAMLEEAGEAFTVPLQIPAACLLGMLSCLVGGTRMISLRPSWKEPGNIWIATVAASGIGKTPCAAAFFAPIKRLEHEAFRQWLDEYATYENEVELVRKERAKAKRGDPMPGKPIQPQRRQAYIDDATVEALGEVLSENPRGIMWRKDELAGLIADLDKYSSGNSGGGTRSRLLSSYDGQEWKTSRTSNPTRNLYIPHAYVGIFGGIQPAMLPKVFEAGSAGVDEASGFLQRFMLIRAEREQPGYWTERYLSQRSKDLLTLIAAALWAWDIEYDADGREVKRIVPVSSKAKAVFVEWFNTIAQEEFISQNAALLSKLKGQAQRLCLLLHSLDAALAGTNGMKAVSEDCMRRALLLANWVKEHQEQCWRFFSPERGVKQSGPVEMAIMQVVVENAATIEANGWRIKSSALHDLVSAKLGMPGMPQKTVAAAASSLGLGTCYMGRDRGRTIPEEKISSFKTSVVSVVSVARPTAPTVCKVTPSVVASVVSVVCDDPPTKDDDGYNRYAKPSVVRETVAPQGFATDTTDTTVNSDIKSIPAFDSPDFPDEVRI